MEEFERPLIFVSLEGSSSAIRDLGRTLRDGIRSELKPSRRGRFTDIF